MLNRANRASVTAAVEALALAPGRVAADVGFGGGLSLDLLLDQVGPAGRVYGFDISRVMLDRARRQHRRAIADGRLVLHEASMIDLPLADASVDAAMTVNTIYFLPDETFAELARMLSPTRPTGSRPRRSHGHGPQAGYGPRVPDTPGGRGGGRPHDRRTDARRPPPRGLRRRRLPPTRGPAHNSLNASGRTRPPRAGPKAPRW